jgi:hypothetical protein
MTSYIINIIQLIHRTLSYDLRKSVNVSFIYALNRPLNSVAIAFEDFTRQRKRSAKYNVQKMVLERMLNLYYYGQDKWATASDPTASGGIYIEQAIGNLDFAYSWTNTEGTQQDYSWRNSETPASQSYSWTDAEVTNLIFDFKVKIPAAFTYNENEVRGLVDRYKLAGKSYTIETY